MAQRDCEEIMKKRTVIIACMIMLMAVGLYARQAKTVDFFEISPNPMDRVTTIYLSFESPMAVNITIENTAGELIRTVYTGLCDKNASFTWERDDAEGNYVPAGTYYVTVRHQSRYTSTKKTLILK